MRTKSQYVKNVRSELDSYNAFANSSIRGSSLDKDVKKHLTYQLNDLTDILQGSYIHDGKHVATKWSDRQLYASMAMAELSNTLDDYVSQKKMTAANAQEILSHAQNQVSTAIDRNRYVKQKVRKTDLLEGLVSIRDELKEKKYDGKKALATSAPAKVYPSLEQISAVPKPLVQKPAISYAPISGVSKPAIADNQQVAIPKYDPTLVATIKNRERAIAAREAKVAKEKADFEAEKDRAYAEIKKLQAQHPVEIQVSGQPKPVKKQSGMFGSMLRRAAFIGAAASMYLIGTFHAYTPSKAPAQQAPVALEMRVQDSAQYKQLESQYSQVLAQNTKLMQATSGSSAIEDNDTIDTLSRENEALTTQNEQMKSIIAHYQNRDSLERKVLDTKKATQAPVQQPTAQLLHVQEPKPGEYFKLNDTFYVNTPLLGANYRVTDMKKVQTLKETGEYLDLDAQQAALQAAQQKDTVVKTANSK